MPHLRVSAAAVVLGLSCVLTACSAMAGYRGPVDPSAGPTRPTLATAPIVVGGWTRIDVPGDLLDLQETPRGALVASLDDGLDDGLDDSVVLSQVRGGRVRPLLDGVEVPGDPAGFRLSTDGELAGMTADPDGEAATYTGAELDRYGEVWQGEPAGEDGAPPGWVAPVFDGEQDVRVVGAVPSSDGWQIRAWFYDLAPHLIDRGDELYHHSAEPPGTLLATATEGSVVVAGPLSTSPGGRAEVGVWELPDGWYQGRTYRWRRLPLPVTPDAFTAVSSWGVGWWLAGHRHGRPVLLDFDTDWRRALLVKPPDIRLDPVDPAVRIAGIPKRMVISAQTAAAGPGVWARTGRTWARLPPPPGPVSDLATDGRAALVVVDGALWRHPLDG